MDQPGSEDNERNVMTQSYNLIVKGSLPLNIVSSSPNGTVKGSTETIPVDLQVETDDGAEEGKAFCSFSPTGLEGSYVEMLETNSYQHKQQIYLGNGNYRYYFRCTDLGGNTAVNSTAFSVFVDRAAPAVTRVYRDEAAGLKVVTNEDAQCAYSLTTCNFAIKDGIQMGYSNVEIMDINYAEWKANTNYYIKCQDSYGNAPNPNECSVIVRAV